MTILIADDQPVNLRVLRAQLEAAGHTVLEAAGGVDALKALAAAPVENEFAYPDGSKAWFELSLQPIPEGIFILSLNITERKIAAEKIRQQLDELPRWQRVMINREARLQALKTEVNELLARQKLPPRYGGSAQP